jgi:hypothetical protein
MGIYIYIYIYTHLFEVLFVCFSVYLCIVQEEEFLAALSHMFVVPLHMVHFSVVATKRRA